MARTLLHIPTTARKGEVVEDAYRAALAVYRHHRARLYEAAGVCLDARGDTRAAIRHPSSPR